MCIWVCCTGANEGLVLRVPVLYACVVSVVPAVCVCDCVLWLLCVCHARRVVCAVRFVVLLEWYYLLNSKVGNPKPRIGTRRLDIAGSPERQLRCHIIVERKQRDTQLELLGPAQMPILQTGRIAGPLS